MANTKKTKTSKEKRVLIASLVVAAVMVGGSTFAWFASKDEVTNRLSAKAEYNTSIVEDFTPSGLASRSGDKQGRFYRQHRQHRRSGWHPAQRQVYRYQCRYRSCS